MAFYAIVSAGRRRVDVVSIWCAPFAARPPHAADSPKTSLTSPTRPPLAPRVARVVVTGVARRSSFHARRLVYATGFGSRAPVRYRSCWLAQQCGEAIHRLRTHCCERCVVWERFIAGGNPGARRA